MVAIGTNASLAYWQDRDGDFERFLAAVIRGAGAAPTWTCDVGDGERVQWRTGPAGGSRLLFATNLGAATHVTFSGPGHEAPGAVVQDLRTGESFAIERAGDRVSISLPLDVDAVRVLRFGSESSQ